MKLNHLNLSVTGTKLAQAFLAKYFGMSISGKPNEHICFLTDDNGMVLSLANMALGSESEVRYPATFHIVFIQPTEGDVDAMNDRLRAAGMKFRRRLDSTAPGRSISKPREDSPLRFYAENRVYSADSPNKPASGNAGIGARLALDTIGPARLSRNVLSNKMKLNLIVLRSSDMERLASFYEAIGIRFEKHQHSKSPVHMGGEIDGVVFEIYPKRNKEDETTNLRIGFQVQSIVKTLKKLEGFEYKLVTEPKMSPWGLRAVIDDIEGHRIELTEKIENQSVVTTPDAALPAS